MPDVKRVAKFSAKGVQAALSGHSKATLPRWQAVECLWEVAMRPWGRQRVLFGVS